MPRLWPFRRHKRVLDLFGGERFEDRPDLLSTPEGRRAATRDIDMVALYGAVFAAVRKRSWALLKPRLMLVRQRGEKLIEEPDDHPALQPLYVINEGLTHRQGIALIGEHKYTEGDAFWLKRRNGLGTPVEFEIWPPHEVEVIADPKKPWVPAAFKRHKGNGGSEQVATRDVVWMRYMIDPRNSLRSLSPIGAIRYELETGLEARRFNRSFFDNATPLGMTFTAEDISQVEAQRVEKELATKFRGADRAYRTAILPGGLKPIELKGAVHKDIEFLAQLNFTVEEVARAYDMAPELLGAGNRTYENAPAAWRNFWETVTDDFDAICEEFNEFYIWPDFGREYSLMGRYDGIQALQTDRLLQAQLDDIYLKNGKTTINEVRERDGLDPVDWGDVPLVPNNIVPLGTYTPPPVVPGRYERSLEGDMRRAWAKRLTRELGRILAHLAAADRTISVGDVDTYDWDWQERYGKEVAAELKIAYIVALEDAGFVPTPLLTAQKLATAFAKAEGAKLLGLRGKWSVTATTRERVKALVAQTIDEGQSLNWLTKQLRESEAFGKTRAETIALTETRTAQGDASIKAYTSLGHEGKQWSARPDACDECQIDGEIVGLNEYFSNGAFTVPQHPHCYCNVDPVREMPREFVLTADSEAVAWISGKGNGRR